ncbi:MAG: hypothetical protein MUE83_02870 [Tabrizicola sp.]|jgi:hypothetical protein|nr:hypothetical protein [Tabrizicola sp.]
MFITPNAVIEAATAFAPLRTSRAEYAEAIQVTPDTTSVDLVIAPLIGVDFDAIDVIERLARAKFRGRVRFMSKGLPNRQMVLRELQAVAEGKGIVVELRDSI